MNFEGKVCGICNKGKLHGFKEEIAEGIYVDAYKCDRGHISYSKEVMEKIEAFYRNFAEERHIVKVGSSIAVPIPASIVKLLNLKPKEKVFVTVQDNRIIIRPGMG